jgi:hypothetical protein
VQGALRSGQMPGRRHAGPGNREWMGVERWTVKATDPRADQASQCPSLGSLASARRVAGKEVLHQRIIHVEGGGGEVRQGRREIKEVTLGGHFQDA